ncbi:hypothetical protein CSOJ01_13940 [Colletotrichum sojae]|uniref:Uncharacterized protein n=1 Tax=Colletotrichum sojae TaxID=2175907 RepID=A0A8H6MKJ0_9PEZI|nr:hypothetical protein CSOJ01_13940 [Colletotrichum sojae]
MSRIPPESGLELQPLITHRPSFDRPPPSSPNTVSTNTAPDTESARRSYDCEAEHGPELQAVNLGDDLQNASDMDASSDEESTEGRQENRASGDINDQKEDAIDTPTAKASWQPTWLRRSVLAAFFALFSAMTATLIIFLSLSEKNDVITVIAALWGRVESQAMRYMPAIAVSADGEHLDHKYSLNYLSLLYPKAIFRAIGLRHHMVYLASFISLLLKAQIALAPGLFNLIDVPDESPTATFVLDSFNTTGNFSGGYGRLAYNDGKKSIFSYTSDHILGPLAFDRYYGKVIDPLDTSIYDSETLLNSTVDLFQRMGAFIAHCKLRKKSQAGLETMGVLVQTRTMLSVGRKIGGWMIGAFSLMTFLNIVILLEHGRIARLATWHRDPATTFGSMVLLRQQKWLASGTNTHDGALCFDQIKTSWATSSYLPLALRFGTRVLAAIFILGLMACVIMTQRLSDSFHGLTNVAEGDNTHLLWTSLPALVLLSVSLYTGSCAMALRALYAFWLPTSEACSTADLDRSLFDMLSVRVLYRSARLGAHGVTVSQFLAFACAILTTLASVLLTPEKLTPAPLPMSLRQATRFVTRPRDLRQNPVDTRNTLSSLLLRKGDANFTYPPDTWDDLVFPTLKYPAFGIPDPLYSAEGIPRLANVENRIAINESSVSEDGLELPLVNATVNYKPQLRLIQNAGPTYAIVAILSAVFLFNLWSLCSAVIRRFGGNRRKLILDMDERGIAPEDSSSFAAMAGLLHDSKVYEHLPSNIESLSDEELHGLLSHLRFRMGWFQNKEGSETGRHFTIGVLYDPNTLFLGSKRDMAQSDDEGEGTMP